MRVEHVPALLAGALVLVLGFDEGGFASASWVWSVVPLMLVAGAFLAGLAARPSPMELWFLAVLAGLLVWTLVSSIWSLDPTASVLDGERLLLYVSSAAAFVLLARPGSRLGLLVGVLVAVAVLCVAGLADVAVGDDPIGAVTDDPGSEDRLAEPSGTRTAWRCSRRWGRSWPSGSPSPRRFAACAQPACCSFLCSLRRSISRTRGAGGSRLRSACWLCLPCEWAHWTAGSSSESARSCSSP